MSSRPHDTWHTLMERHLDRRVHIVKEGGEQLHWYMVSKRRGGQAAINPSRSQSTLKKRGLIKFSFCLSLSLPLPLLFLSDAQAETNPRRLSVGLFRGWNNLLWVRGTLQCLAKKSLIWKGFFWTNSFFSQSSHAGLNFLCSGRFSKAADFEMNSRTTCD